MIEVELPDGSIAEFPEGTSNDVMKSVIQKRFSAPAQNEATPAQEDDGFSALEMAKNIPSSTGHMIKGLLNVVLHPINTGKAIANTAKGSLYKANAYLDENTPDSLDFMAVPIGGGELLGKTEEPYADALIGGLKNRYGSGNDALNTLEKDPVGVAADLATVLSGVGAITKSEMLARAGAAINPINAAVNGGKILASALIPKKLPSKMYEDVAKFSTTIPEKDRASMIATALENNIMPTSSGVKKLDVMIDGLNGVVDDLIERAHVTGKSIPKDAVFKYLKDLQAQKGGVRLDAPKDLDAIDNIAGEFSNHLEKIGKSSLSVEDLQKLKVETYKSINWDAKRMAGSPIKEDTFKAIARAAKEGVEELAPDVKETNAKLGKLLELEPNLQRAANRIENRNTIPIDVPLQIGAGSSAGGPAGSAIGTVASILGTPKIKAAIALKLNEMLGQTPIQQILANNPNLSMSELIGILTGRAITDNPQSSQQQ